MEVDPRTDSNTKYDSNLRVSLLADLLSNYLSLECTSSQDTVKYTPGYFLGRHEVIFLQLVSEHAKEMSNVFDFFTEKTRISQNSRQSIKTRERFADEKRDVDVLR